MREAGQLTQEEQGDEGKRDAGDRAGVALQPGSPRQRQQAQRAQGFGGRPWVARQLCHDVVEHLGDLGRALDPVLRPLGEQLVDDGRQLGRDLRIELANRPMRDLGDGVQHLERRCAAEWRPAGAHRVQDAPHAEEIGAVIEGLAPGLLGAHIKRRAGDVAGLRQPHVLGGAGQAEIGEQHPAGPRFDQNIAGLDVAMDQQLLVSGGQGGGNLPADLQGVADLERAALGVEPILQRHAVDQPHHQKRDRIVVLLDVVDGDDVLVSDGARRARLADEAVARQIIAGVLRIEDLEGNLPLQVGVEGAEDQPHAAAADQFDDVEPPELADGPRLLGRVEEIDPGRRKIAGEVAAPVAADRPDGRVWDFDEFMLQLAQGRPVGRGIVRSVRLRAARPRQKIRVTGRQMLDRILALGAIVEVRGQAQLLLGRDDAVNQLLEPVG